MRRIWMAMAFAPLVAFAADLEGRWTGRLRIPGADFPMVLDLAPDRGGAWSGSLTVPGLDIQGTPLSHLEVNGNAVSFDTADVLAGRAPGETATFAARLANGTLAGEMRQVGGAAPFTLRRIAAAQVDRAMGSTPVSAGTEGRWVGRYELGGYPRNVTVDIANQGAQTPRVDFVIVGKATTKLPIDLVSEREGVLRIESKAYAITFEGRIRGDEIAGTFEQAIFEVPLVLRRGS